MDESTESPTQQRISFSFEHHKSSLKQSSAELYRALKLMTWRSKSTLLSSDQGLIELTSHFSSGQTSIKSSILMSFLLACVLFSSVTALLFLIEVKEASIKWPIAAAAFVFGLVAGMVYFMYFLKRQKILQAVSDLTNSFQKDVHNLLTSPTDLRTMDQSAKVLIVVEAINVLRNLLVRTYLVGNRFQNRAALTHRYLLRVATCFNSLMTETGVSL